MAKNFVVDGKPVVLTLWDTGIFFLTFSLLINVAGQEDVNSPLCFC